MLGYKSIVFDTETSDLYDFRKDADDQSQGRLASLAAICLDEDMQIEREFYALVKPDGWVLKPGAAAINGLTMERLEAEGIPVADVVDMYARALDEGRVMVAFNSQFDAKVMRGEMRRLGVDDRFHSSPQVCLMRACTDVCRIPSANGRGYKWPKLAQAYQYFFGPGNNHYNAHHAMGDAGAALEIFRQLAARHALPAPQVFYKGGQKVST
jgi:DNA polymerase-3 subunit epsilon